MQNVSQNLSFLLWHKQVPQSNWFAMLAGWAGCSETRAKKLLRGASPIDAEVQAIAQATNTSDEDLVYKDLLADCGKDIWQENVLYLLGNYLKHGKQQELAVLLGISSGSISDWKNYSHKPERKYKTLLHSFFGLSDSVDLEKHPLFLSLSPIGLSSQKAWLHNRIDEISDRELDRLFPALEKLLADE
jgi:hypothetical protein